MVSSQWLRTVSSGCSRSKVASTALRMVDIHNSAVRLRPKPMLPKAAKITRTITRKQKRAITSVVLRRVDVSSRVKSGISAKLGIPLCEIVAANRLVERMRLAGGRGCACPDRRRTGTLRIDERHQDRKRQIRMVGFNRLIDPFGKFALARQRAIPFTVVIDDTANLPLRQLQFDQRKRGIGPGARLNQPLDPRGFLGAPNGRKTPASLADDFRHQLRGHGMRALEPVFEFAVIAMFRKQRHGVTHTWRGRQLRPRHAMWSRRHLKTRRDGSLKDMDFIKAS